MKKKAVEGGLGVIWGNLFFMSGWSNVPEEGETVDHEIRKALEQMGEAMRSVGTSFEHVLKATIYLSDLNDRKRCLNRIWKEYFPKDPPARTCVQSGLGECRVELDFIVGIPDK